MENKENLPMKQTMALDFSNRETIAVLKATVAKGTTDAEFAMFAELVKSTGLNPFKKEIWCIVIPEKEWTDRSTGEKRKKDRSVQIMGGINGFYEIANQQPEYDGMEKGFIGKSGEYLPSTYPKDDYIGAWTKVYRKDRKFPHEECAFLSEFDKATGNWKTQKRVMIQKCADALGLRKSFPQKLNGLYIPEEMPLEYDLKIEDSGGNSGAPAVPLLPADSLPAPTGDVIGFGKHKGKQWSEVPGDYLEWVWGQGGKDAGKAKAELDRRLDDQSLNINKEAEEAGAY